MPYLPPELVDEIAHSLPEEVLGRFSLVSRTWASYCRSRLFRTIYVRLEDVEHFWVLLRSPLITFVSSVQELVFTHGTACLDGAVFTSEVAQIVPELLNVTTLHIRNEDVSWVSPVLWESLLWWESLVWWTRRKLPGVRALSLNSVGMEDLSILRELACGFPALQSLSLTKVRWANNDFRQEEGEQGEEDEEEEEDGLSIYQIPKIPPGLSHISLTECYKSDILDWLYCPTYQVGPPMIETLTIPCVHASDVASLSEALAAAGPKLRHFTFGFFGYHDLDGDETEEAFLSSIDLRRNSELRTVRIALELSLLFFASPLPYLAQIISQLSHHANLTTISFWLNYQHCFDQPDGLSCSDETIMAFWHALDLLGREGQFPGLHSLVFELPPSLPVQHSDLEDNIAQKLPRFAKRGLLRFMDVDPWVTRPY